MVMREKGYQILFVDQDEDVCLAMIERLTPAGYRVISACNLDESLSLAKIGLFDLYLFGRLCQEAPSTRLCCMIRDFDEETPILFCSGSTKCRGRESLLDANPEALEQAIARLLPVSDPKSTHGFLASRPGQSPAKVAIIGLGKCLDLGPVRRYVNLLPPQAVVMTNGACDVGLAAEAAAKEQGLTTTVLPLNWHRYGRKARWQSNRQLLECADRVALFWDHHNQEALSLLRFAQKLRKPIEFYTLQNDQVACRSAPATVPDSSLRRRASI
jgi:CheY-like chemotaxis protein